MFVFLFRNLEVVRYEWFNNCYIDIPLPSEIGRKELLSINLRGVKLADDFNLEELSKKFDGYSGADITVVRTYYIVAALDVIY